MTVGMVLTFTLLAVPRASVPMTLPLPRVDRAEARRSADEERDLATRTEAEGLPFEVRAVGEALRHFGRSSAKGADTSHDLEDIRARVQVVLGAKQTPLLLRLRAVQTQYFFRELRRFARDGKSNAELKELGGDFLEHARKSGWLDSAGQLLSDETTLRVLFRLRWADLIGKRTIYPFSLSLNEWRIYYRFLLQHPEGDGVRSDAQDDAVRLRIATALGRKDPEFPTEMAQGYLLYQLGNLDAAAVAYRRQLSKHPGGPYALLARNYLIYTLQGVSSE
ncbi:MAG TPA: hypothetical protein VNW92_11180 [Polyangiaceae bacterium]|nr:hypothetical protein [Polyangiaceae bacterium]